MEDLVYGTDGEQFNSSSIDEAISCFCDDTDLRPGNRTVVFEGRKVEIRAANHIPHMAECITERVYEVCDELADSYGFSKEEEQELQDLTAMVVDYWERKNNLKPTFYAVDQVKEITIEFTDDKGDFKIVND